MRSIVERIYLPNRMENKQIKGPECLAGYKIGGAVFHILWYPRGTFCLDGVVDGMGGLLRVLCTSPWFLRTVQVVQPHLL